MKKLIIITTLLFCTSTGIAQVHKHTLGLRYGTGYLFKNSELSYQLGLNQKNRLEFGLGYRQNKFDFFEFRKLSTSIYFQHVMNIRGGLNWYFGAGVKHDFSQHMNSDMTTYQHRFSVGPTIGLEYDFNKKNVPLILALDYRPSFVFSPSTADQVYFRNQFGLSLRYTFKDKPSSN
ncbi:MAG: hypothetical protein GQ574_11595 [Crocinitomix sp.]|nr:hypothetical protein [Crocinitomix sp.]